jgi:hypothetical protein
MCNCTPELVNLTRRERRRLGKTQIAVHAADCPLGATQRARPFGIIEWRR